MAKMKPAGKALIIAMIFGALVGLYFVVKSQGLISKIAPQGRQNQSILGGNNSGSNSNSSAPIDDPNATLIRVGVVTWPGYVGGQYFNGGFKASKESRYYKDYGILVEFIVLDDFVASRKAWVSGEVDLLWVTADAYPTEVAPFVEQGLNPQFVFQSDWSRGGDAIVVVHGINNVADLRGKKIAVAAGTPSNTFLLLTLQAAGMEYNDVKVVAMGNAIDAAAAFKSGSVDAAVVWSPDDDDCVNSVVGSKVLTSTQAATHIIADGFFCTKAFLEKNQKEVANLVEGWMIGAAEVNTNPEAREKAVKILAAGLPNTTEDWARNGIGKVRLTTYGDNVNFFALNSSAYRGVTGEALYNKMGKLYYAIGLAPATFPAWRTVSTASVIQSLRHLANMPGQEAEGSMVFSTPKSEDFTAPALATKTLSVTFATGSDVLDENAKVIIDMGFSDEARTFASAKIRIEGNTDSTGSREANIALSQRRAQTVANYLITKYGFDPNRFVVVGNGPDKPISDNSTAEGKARNRRTDFSLLQ